MITTDHWKNKFSILKAPIDLNMTNIDEVSSFIQINITFHINHQHQYVQYPFAMFHVVKGNNKQIIQESFIDVVRI